LWVLKLLWFYEYCEFNGSSGYFGFCGYFVYYGYYSCFGSFQAIQVLLNVKVEKKFFLMKFEQNLNNNLKF
jgi:hypothetical protein